MARRKRNAENEATTTATPPVAGAEAQTQTSAPRERKPAERKPKFKVEKIPLYQALFEDEDLPMVIVESQALAKRLAAATASEGQEYSIVSREGISVTKIVPGSGKGNRPTIARAVYVVDDRHPQVLETELTQKLRARQEVLAALTPEQRAALDLEDPEE